MFSLSSSSLHLRQHSPTDDSPENFLSQFLLKLALGAFFGHLPQCSDAESLMNEETRDVVERPIFKPFLQHHESLFNLQPFRIED